MPSEGASAPDLAAPYASAGWPPTPNYAGLAIGRHQQKATASAKKVKRKLAAESAWLGAEARSASS